ncbi:MAG TPA: type II toxin-antitoxin system RelE/ParE family toxin [Longimicrobium sp.]|nr:type II toxin-antitoxin system RelE/ParE family toxin [Longimicrobium sp.]
MSPAWSLKPTRKANADIREAHDWYEERSPDAALEFLDAIDRCLAEIARAPEQFQIVYVKRVRRALLNTFPYVLYFRGGEETDSRDRLCARAARSQRLAGSGLT